MKAILLILSLLALTAIAVPIYDNTQLRLNVPKDGSAIDTVLNVPLGGGFSLIDLRVLTRVIFTYSDVGRVITVSHGYSQATITAYNHNFTADADHEIVLGNELVTCNLFGCNLFFRITGSCAHQYLDTCGQTITIDFSVAFQNISGAIFSPASAPYPALHYGYTSRSTSIAKNKYHYFEYLSINTTDIVTIDPDLFSSVQVMGSTTVYPTIDNVGGWVQTGDSASHSFSTVQNTHIGVFCESEGPLGAVDYTLGVGIGASANLVISVMLMMVALLSVLLL